MKMEALYVNDADISKLKKMHPIADAEKRKTLINHMIHENYNRVFGHIYAYANDVALTEDILQETFFRTSRKFNNIKSLSSYVAYNLQTAMNIAKRVVPREKMISNSSSSIYREDGSTNDDQLLAPMSYDPHNITEFKEFKSKVNSFLGRLKKDEREILIRKYIFREPYESIVKKTGINPHTTRSKCSRARKKLRGMLNEYYNFMNI